MNNVSNIAVANFLLSYFGIKKPLTLFFIASLASPLSKAIVGILLITGLLIIPASASRNLSSTPIQMAVIASVVGVFSVIFGLYSSITWNTSTGPSILSAALIIFLASLFPWKKLPIFKKQIKLSDK